MKPLAAIFLLLGILAAHQAYGGGASAQPLTRVDCLRAAMEWDESANVCGSHSRNVSEQPLTRLNCIEAGMRWNDSANVCGTSLAAETILQREASDDASQPLARSQCEMAGLRWNDQANVCGERATHPAPFIWAAWSPILLSASPCHLDACLASSLFRLGNRVFG